MAHDADPLTWAVKELRDEQANRTYDLYANYYDGNHELAFATPKYESAFGNLFRAFAYNRCAVVPDAHADRLQVTGFIASDDAIANQAKELWDANRMDKRQGEVYQEMFTTGDGYVIVWPDEDGQPTIWPQVARQVRVHYSDEQPGKVTTAAKAWMDHEGRIRLNLYLSNRLEKYITRTKAPNGVPISPRSFERYADEDGQDTLLYTWDGNTVPVFHFGNNARTGRYGRSELRDVIPLQDALNKTLTDKMVAMELAAYPQRVLIGVDTEPKLDGGQVNPQGAANDASIQKFQSGIDRILTIAQETAKIAEFQAVALAQFIAVAEFWDTAVSRVSKVPVHYLSLSGGFPSGRALRTAEAPFVAKIEDRQRSIGNTWEDVMTFALHMQGVEAKGLSATWQSAAPMSEEDMWDLALQKKAAGLPLKQILIEAGYDEPTIDDILGFAREAAEEMGRRFDAGQVVDDDGDDQEVAA